MTQEQQAKALGITRMAYHQRLKKWTKTMTDENGVEYLVSPKHCMVKPEHIKDKDKEGAMEYVYEIVDATNDEMYYAIGMFDDLTFCRELIMSACPHQEISEYSDDQEKIQVRRRKLNSWDDNNDVVFEAERELVFIEELDESLWRTTINIDIKESEL